MKSSVFEPFVSIAEFCSKSFSTVLAQLLDVLSRKLFNVDEVKGFSAKNNHGACSFIEDNPFGGHVANLQCQALPVLLHSMFVYVPKIYVFAKCTVLPAPNKQDLSVVISLRLIFEGHSLLRQPLSNVDRVETSLSL